MEISDELRQEGAGEEERLIQAVRAEIYDTTPLIAVHGASFGSQKDLAIRTVSKSNLQALFSISQTKLADLGSNREGASLVLEPARELEQLVRKTDRVTAPLAVAMGLSLVTQFLNGYNTAGLNAVSQVVFPGHSTTEWAIAVGCFAIGGPLGSMVAGGIADSLGRKQAMLMCTNTFLVGGLAMTFAPNIQVLSLARVILGFGSGVSSVLVPIYMGELAPPSMRGFFGTCTQMALVCGILAANLIAFPLATPDGWRLMCAVIPVLCGLQLLLAPLLHESPRWLLQRNPHSAQAALSLKQLYNLATDREVDLEICHILNAAEKHSLPNSQASLEHKLSAPPPSSNGNGNGFYAAKGAALEAQGGPLLAEGTMPLKGGESEGAYGRTGDASAPPPRTRKPAWGGPGTAEEQGDSALALMLADPTVRPLVMVAVVLHMSQQFCGINAVFYYSTDFFRGVIDNPLLGSTLVGAINVIATLAATFLMDQVGRRTLMAVSAGGMIVSTALVVAALLHVLPNFVALAAVMTFVCFFEFGLGPIPWLIVPEMFEPKYVASAQSLACQINWFCNFLVGVGFPFMQQALGPWSFVPFGVVLVACLCFVLQRMPETRGASINDVKYQVKVMWGIFDELFKDKDLSADARLPSSGSSLDLYKERMRRRRDNSGSFDDESSHPFMLE